MVDSLNYFYDYDELSNSQKEAIITLIEKKDKDERHLSNWRPISLINVDVKIGSKAIAKRLQNVLPNIIHHNQCAYVKGRTIFDAPSNPEAQQLTFSSCKNSNTLKALVGIIPKGSIAFVSTLFGRSISDKEITLRSGLVEKLKYGDCIMADRGFNIQEMLASKGVSVNVPPFMNESGQFEERQLLETRRIATLGSMWKELLKGLRTIIF
ncbi:uncharacterized protein [Acropora muricata]|uniref:uncharacterized protein n=1 Tax=Acropora muricata TaxID=159855 RepID=UPI0034E40373